MVRRLLIIGMIPFDSGKTQLAIRIGEHLVSQGEHVEYFKPLSGHNYWYKYRHTMKCIETGQLVSYDASRVRERVPSRVSPLFTNPVHTLFVPARLERPDKPYLNSLGFGGWDSFMVLQRFTRADGEQERSTVLVARDLVEQRKVMIAPEEVHRLTAEVETVDVKSLEEAQAYERTNFDRAVESAFERVESKADTVLIESFNDSVWPWEGLTHVGAVVLVGPGHAFMYDPEKMRRAALLVRRGDAPLREVTFLRVEDLLRPVKSFHLSPETGLTDDQLEILLRQSEKE